MIPYIAVSFALTALLFSTIALIFAFLAWSTLVGFKNSTHRVQYIPVKDPEFNQFSETDLAPKLDPETGEPIPVNGGDESTGLGLLNEFKKKIHVDEEDY
jgi:hypothetical protein